jgi:hypothetical protein
MAATTKRLAGPRPIAISPGAGGRPAAVGRVSVDTVREDWVVEDRWWTGRPLRRRYFELVLDDGRNLVVFHDIAGDRWFSQRG